MSAASALSELTHNRWALPVLAHVAQHGGCKFVTLSRRLGAAPASLRRALHRLGELGLVIRNPGYGHPMRPEYVLGPVGERTEGLASSLLQWIEADGLSDELLKKWQLPVLVGLGSEPCRFGEIRRGVPATPRAVTLALKSHGALGLVSRHIIGDYPPVPLYAVTGRGRVGRAPALQLGRVLAAGGATPE
ncbi:MAG: winged helix-turn-helix transcriptional regulator [Myxococcota bacterium]